MDNLSTRVVILDDFGNYDYSYFDNAGKMITNGLELTLTAQPARRLFAEINATFQNTKDKLDGHENIKVAYSPELLGYVKIKYNVSNDFSIALNGRYVGSMETFWDDSPDENYAQYVPVGRIGKKVNGYSELGINFRYENLFIKNSFINLKISNLLNEDIRYPTFTNNTWADKGTLDYSRSIHFSIGKEF